MGGGGGAGWPEIKIMKTNCLKTKSGPACKGQYHYRKVQNSLHAGIFFMLLLSFAVFFFKNNFFENIFQEHFSINKQFGSRSGSTFYGLTAGKSKLT